MLCAQYPERKGAETAVWRVSEKLGIDRSNPKNKLKNLTPEDQGNAELVVIERAAGQGFEEAEDSWPESLKTPKRADGWLLIEWSRPRFEQNSRLWKHVQAYFKNRIVLVMTVEDMRLSGMLVSRALSWERTVEDLQREICDVWKTALDGCTYLVISLQTSGAILFSEEGRKAKLIYDPAHIEGSWSDDYDGSMSGQTRCLTAGIALAMIRNPKSLDGSGVRAGVIAARELLKIGFDSSGGGTRADTSLPEDLKFPASKITDKLCRAVMEQGADYDGVRVQEIPARVLGKKKDENWRILDSHFADRDLFEDARRIVTSGVPLQPWPFPTARIGDLFLTERSEMEHLRSVRNLIIDYLGSKVAKPLSVAVFGRPGSGKSFAIKEIAAQLAENDHYPKIKALTFNLSQFVTPDAISSALHQVRDVGLSGSMPLVFWDEFDANYEMDLGWLRYFLAPMQDGEFLVGSNTHSVGRAIFVFAGGIYHTAGEFLGILGEDRRADDSRRAQRGGKLSKVSGTRLQHAKNAKLPDFLSRLKGFLDIPVLDYSRRGKLVDGGSVPRARETVFEYIKRLKVDPDPSLTGSTLGYDLDLAIALRRAAVLRAILLQVAPHLVSTIPRKDSQIELQEQLNIDRGLLGAFLLVEKFHYAARSIESIVKMSTLSRKGIAMFDRSSLPPPSQLDLHVDSRHFLALAQLQWASDSSG